MACMVTSGCIIHNCCFHPENFHHSMILKHLTKIINGICTLISSTNLLLIDQSRGSGTRGGVVKVEDQPSFYWMAEQTWVDFFSQLLVNTFYFQIQKTLWINIPNVVLYFSIIFNLKVLKESTMNWCQKVCKWD